MSANQILELQTISKIAAACDRRDQPKTGSSELKVVETASELSSNETADRREPNDMGETDGLDEFGRDHELSQLVRFIPIQTNGDRPPLYFIHTLGEGFEYCRKLLPYLGDDQPVYGISTLVDGQHLLDGDVTPYAEALLEHQPSGPYHLVGIFCGGRPAVKLACHLRDGGGDVASLSLLHSLTDLRVFKHLTTSQRVVAHLASWWQTPLAEMPRRVQRVLRQLFWQGTKHELPPERQLAQRNFRFAPLAYKGNVTLFRLRETLPFMDAHLGWRSIVTGEVFTRDLPGDWSTLFQEPAIRAVGQGLRETIDDAGL